MNIVDIVRFMGLELNKEYSFYSHMYPTRDRKDVMFTEQGLVYLYNGNALGEPCAYSVLGIFDRWKANKTRLKFFPRVDLNSFYAIMWDKDDYEVIHVTPETKFRQFFLDTDNIFPSKEVIEENLEFVKRWLKY